MLKNIKPLFALGFKKTEQLHSEEKSPCRTKKISCTDTMHFYSVKKVFCNIGINTKNIHPLHANQADILTGNHFHLQNMAGHTVTLVKCNFNHKI